MRQLSLYMILMVGIAATGLARAQQAPAAQDPEQQRVQVFMSMWNPQRMIDGSVKQAVERYHLTPEQEQVARKMTTDGVNAFLDKHEAELRSVVVEAIRARISGTTPTAEQAGDWAKRAMPLFEEGQKAILDGNHEFRDVLNDDQKKIFDEDQRVIQQQVSRSRSMLDRWTKGQFDPKVDWSGQRPPRPEPTPAPASQPQLDRWDLYVRGFISRYKLDGTQTSQAMGILSESKNRATEYYYSRRAEIEAANQQIKELLADPAQRDKVPQARKQLEDLNKPIDNLYAEMQQRLGQIPTEQQRTAYEAEVKARRERWRDRIRRNDGNTALSATSQSQPASSQLARAADPAGSQPGAVTQPGRIAGPGTQPATATAPASQPGRIVRAPN